METLSFSSHFDPRQFLDQIDAIDASISQKGQDIGKIQQILIAADSSLKTLVDSISGDRSELSSKEVAWMGTALLKLNKIQSKLSGLQKRMKKTAEEQKSQDLSKNFNHLFETTLKMLLSDPRFADAAKIKVQSQEVDLLNNERYLPLVREIFTHLLSNISAGAAEEVFGQERPKKALPKWITSQLLSERPPKEQQEFRAAVFERVIKIGAALYPMALISASQDSTIPVPSPEIEQQELERDKNQFESELNGQFGEVDHLGKVVIEPVKVWNKDFLGQCLKAVWDEKRNK